MNIQMLCFDEMPKGKKKFVLVRENSSGLVLERYTLNEGKDWEVEELDIFDRHYQFDLEGFLKLVKKYVRGKATLYVEEGTFKDMKAFYEELAIDQMIEEEDEFSDDPGYKNPCIGLEDLEDYD